MDIGFGNSKTVEELMKLWLKRAMESIVEWLRMNKSISPLPTQFIQSSFLLSLRMEEEKKRLIWIEGLGGTNATLQIKINKINFDLLCLRRQGSQRHLSLPLSHQLLLFLGWPAMKSELSEEKRREKRLARWGGGVSLICGGLWAARRHNAPQRED